MLSINIVYDEGEVVVHQQEIYADAEQLVKFIEGWRTVAGEPCPHGHKCEVIKRMIEEISEIMGGIE